MKHTYIYTLALTAALLTACEASDETTATGGGELTPVCATATLPATTGSGTVTRAFSDNNILGLLLSYPAADAAETLTPYIVASADIKEDVDYATNNKFSFSTANGDAENNIKPLYWQQVSGKGLTEQTFYTILIQKETVLNTTSSIYANILWGKADYTPASTTDNDITRPTLAFGTLKSRYAMLTVKINAPTTDRLDASLMRVFYSAKNMDESGIGDIEYQAAPTEKDDDGDELPVKVLKSDEVYTSTAAPTGKTQFIAYAMIAPQALTTGKTTLYLAYNVAQLPDGTDTYIKVNAAKPSYIWTLDLSTVKVTRAAGSEFATAPTDMGAYGTHGPGFAFGTAFGYNAGERITLTLNVSLMNLQPGTVESFVINDYTAADDSYSYDTTPTKKP